MSISESILTSIEVGEGLLAMADGLKYLPYRMIWGNNLQGYQRDSVQSVLSRLSKQGLVKKRIDRGQVYLALTNLGVEFLNKKKRKPGLSLEKSGKKWDGLYRFILFDIPERDRIVRDTLRNALKSLGAVCWQRSVWVTKENIIRELNKFFDDNGLTDYCSVLEVKELYNLKLKKLLEEG